MIRAASPSDAGTHQLREPIAAQQPPEHLRLRDGRLDRFVRAWLCEIALRRSHGAHDGGSIRLAGQHQTHGLRIQPFYLGQKLPTIHAGHAHIGHNDVGRHDRKRREGSGPAREKFHAPLASHAMKGATHGLQYIDLVIDEYDPDGHAASPPSKVPTNNTRNQSRGRQSQMM